MSNIVLDGLQELLSSHIGTREYETTSNGKRAKNKVKIEKYQFVRYADDFVIFSPHQEWLEEILPQIKSWLATRGLEINTEKTKIRNIRTEGFDFLGFHIQQRETTTIRFNSLRYKRISKQMASNVKPNAKRVRLAPKTKSRDEFVYSCIITPSKKEISEFINQLKKVIKESGSKTFEILIIQLNSKLRGWGNYYRHVCSKKIFSRIRAEVFHALLRFLKRRHPQKSIEWIKETYFTTVDKDKWTPFAKSTSKRKDIITLVNIAKDIPITRHTKVTGANSIFDPELIEYWRKRNLANGKSRFAKGSKFDKILTREKGICPICGEPITSEDEFELHHILPVKDGGTNSDKNLIFLHKHCHKAQHRKLHF